MAEVRIGTNLRPPLKRRMRILRRLRRGSRRQRQTIRIILTALRSESKKAVDLPQLLQVVPTPAKVKAKVNPSPPRIRLPGHIARAAEAAAAVAPKAAAHLAPGQAGPRMDDT